MTDSARAAVRFTDALNSNYAALYAFARNLINDGEEARDVVQDVFAEAWRTAQHTKPPFDEQSSAADTHRWLFRVAYNRAISLRRHQRRIALEPLDTLNPPVFIEQNQQCQAAPFEDRLAEGELLRAALSTLEFQDTACVLLRFIYGFAPLEIARILDITPEAARKRLSRAMQRLRVAYFAQEQDSSPSKTEERLPS